MFRKFKNGDKVVWAINNKWIEYQNKVGIVQRSPWGYSYTVLYSNKAEQDIIDEKDWDLAEDYFLRRKLQRCLNLEWVI
jgi:hypothetical protein